MDSIYPSILLGILWDLDALLSRVVPPGPHAKTDEATRPGAAKTAAVLPDSPEIPHGRPIPTCPHAIHRTHSRLHLLLYRLHVWHPLHVLRCLLLRLRDNVSIYFTAVGARVSCYRLGLYPRCDCHRSLRQATLPTQSSFLPPTSDPTRIPPISRHVWQCTSPNQSILVRLDRSIGHQPRRSYCGHRVIRYREHRLVHQLRSVHSRCLPFHQCRQRFERFESGTIYLCCRVSVFRHSK
jgi:hypothetical protein